MVAADGVTLSAIGPEAELYLDRMSLEAWVGWANVDYDIDAFDDDGFFAFGDIAYYVTDDWRISAGASTILGEGSLNLATEYQFADIGFRSRRRGEVRAYEDRWSAKIGLKGYFGDEGKSLIDRHRQDDPRNRVLDLFSAASGVERRPRMRRSSMCDAWTGESVAVSEGVFDCGRSIHRRQS